MALKPILLCLFVLHLSGTPTIEASSLQFVANPLVIKPVLSKKLQVRCAVFNTTQEIMRRNYKNKGLVEGKLISSMEDPQPDVGHLMSIVITKWNKETDQNETVASVAGCLAAGAEFNFLGKVEVEGNTERSPVPGEVGYLKLTWDRPLDQHSGLYSCEASALTSEKHTISLSASLQIVAKEPTISDIVAYISEHDKNITSLKEENQKLKLDLESLMSNTTQNFTEVQQKMALMKGQNTQTGSVTCSDQTILFSQQFKNTPIVYVAFEALSVSGSGTYTTSLSTSAVSVSSFKLSCSYTGHVNTWGLRVRWLATD
ncbi:uncharacterized protein LOC131950990 [Physella acuta]|uniref:uncharacterized protein LOC131950990 n=1 Tax=Physella acuta TaxID=109671 RepID=UPI0027DCA0A1|nr:uncharacterized protein LOC131950990 [Physella acuta]